MATERPAGASSAAQPPTVVPRADFPDAVTQSGPAGIPLYRRLARKEARLREDQYVALSRLVRILARRRTDRSGPRLTENTLIRVAIDLLLNRANCMVGNTESELRASVLDPPRVAADQHTDNA